MKRLIVLFALVFITGATGYGFRHWPWYFPTVPPPVCEFCFSSDKCVGPADNLNAACKTCLNTYCASTITNLGQVGSSADCIARAWPTYCSASCGVYSAARTDKCVNCVRACKTKFDAMIPAKCPAITGDPCLSCESATACLTEAEVRNLTLTKPVCHQYVGSLCIQNAPVLTSACLISAWTNAASGCGVLTTAMRNRFTACGTCQAACQRAQTCARNCTTMTTYPTTIPCAACRVNCNGTTTACAPGACDPGCAPCDACFKNCEIGSFQIQNPCNCPSGRIGRRYGGYFGGGGYRGGYGYGRRGGGRRGGGRRGRGRGGRRGRGRGGRRGRK
uniref:Keratin-associated protein 9-1-like n=1 Tax=Ciona intestinalis TaxID=7719 RepID=F6ZSK5_CIOIN|nr:keratin-associated protein 9-1-like [Ciona intestinalis]|eukprot:XP_026693184.1 keratin-associated protein 9-1-like [Ciona intestinalis]